MLTLSPHHNLAPLPLLSSYTLMCMVPCLCALTQGTGTGYPSLMTSLVFVLCSLSELSLIPSRPSRHSSHMQRITMGPGSRHYEMTREGSTCPMPLFSTLQMLGLSDSTLCETGPNKMELQSGLTGPCLRESLLCLLSQDSPCLSGEKHLLHMCMSGTACLPLLSQRQSLPMSYGMVGNLMYPIFKSGDALLMCMCIGTR